jgi:adsorption protein A
MNIPRANHLRALVSTLVLAGLTLLAIPAHAQERAQAPAFDLGADVSGYQRFLIYPHLQKGRELMDRGDRVRALSEYERARQIAPRSAAMAVYLASAYRQAGDRTRAQSVLREQLTFTPGERRVETALADLTPPVAQAAAVAPTQPASIAALPTPKTPAPPATPRRAARTTPAVSTRAAATPATHPVDDLRAHFRTALDHKRFDDAARISRALLAGQSNNMALVDELSFQMRHAGASTAAMEMLLEFYPFTGASMDDRLQLFDRLSLLAIEHPARVDTHLMTLRGPLDTPALRSHQAALWTELGDCAAVRTILGDLSPEYSYDDLMRLGDCEAKVTPEGAQHAYARAHALQPGGAASLALGYQAYVTRDYATSLGAWKSVPREQLANDHRMAAATTAIEAGEPALAGVWLSDYRTNGGTLHHRFWTSLALTRESAGDTAGAIEALEEATALEPAPADFINLARLSRDPQKQSRWLEQAVKLDGSNSRAFMELAYAYQRSGRHADAVRAFESAASGDQSNMRAQLELGYAYWQQGRVAEAEMPLQRAYAADPGNIAAARQLVYVSQRLSHNREARFYAQRVLDTFPATDDDSTAAGREVAERRFGLQRLHEDLGRRVTLSLDGWTGTRVGAGNWASPAGSPFRSYSQLELDVRLGRTSIRNGRTVSAYARLLADGGEPPSAAPTERPRLGVGLRFKPFSSRVLFVSAEHQHSLEGVPGQEVLLRTSASFLNGQRHSDDWQPAGSRWVAYNLFIDAAHYVRNVQTAATADLRTSVHLKIASRQTFEPYGHLQVSGTRLAQIEHDVRVGVGTRWNVWYGRSTYDADPRKLSFGIEFQRALDTYLPDRSGLFLTLGSRW